MKRRSFFGVLVAPLVATAVAFLPRRKSREVVEINKSATKPEAGHWQVKVDAGLSYRSASQVEHDIIYDAMRLCGLIYNLKDGAARYDVVIGSGPSYASRRQQAVEAYLQLVQAAPQEMAPTFDIGIRMMDIPNADKLADRLRPPGVQDDDQNPIPPQAKLQLQQQGQMIEALTAAVHTLSSKLETKVLDLETRERIALRAEIGGIIQAALKADSAGAAQLATMEMRAADARLDALHTGTALDQEAKSMEQDQQQFEMQMAHEKEMQAQQQAVPPAGGGSPSGAGGQ